MKNLLITITATLAWVGAYGQGSLTFALNSDNLIYFTTEASRFGMVLAPADVGKSYSIDPTTAAELGIPGGPFTLAGSLASSDGTIPVLAGLPSFIVGLFGGTSSTSLSLQTTTTIDSWANGNPGGIVPVIANLHSPFAAGTPAWFQVEVYDSRAANAPDAWMHGEYAGVSPIFVATPLIVPNYIYSTTPPVNSTWAPGWFNPTDAAAMGFQDDFFGEIALGVVRIPEPGTSALAGLGAAVLMIFRRRG